MKRELPKTYDPSDFEGRIYADWQEKGYFAPDMDAKKGHYTIVTDLQPREARTLSILKIQSLFQKAKNYIGDGFHS